MKKFTFFLIFFSLILPPAAGAQKTVFRLGTLPVIDTLPLILADQEDLFNKEGLTVQLYQFNSALERDAALSSGKLDGYFGDLVITMLLNESGQNIKVLCESYHTLPRHRMFAIAAAPGSEISSAADIKDIPVAISTGSVIEFMLDRILLKNNLDPAAINKTEVKAIPIRYQMLITETLKLALLPEPLATRAEQEGAKIIADDRLLDTTATIIAVKQDFILRNPDFAAAFMRAYSKSAAMINANYSCMDSATRRSWSS